MTTSPIFTSSASAWVASSSRAATLEENLMRTTNLNTSSSEFSAPTAAVPPGRSAGLLHGSAPDRGDAQRGDTITMAAQHAEAKSVEREGLPRLGDRSRLMDDEAGNRGGLGVGQIPLHGA